MLLYTMDFSWIIILITTILVGMFMLKRRMREGTGNVPKPPSLPFIGQSFSVDLQNVHFTFAKYAEKYGKIFQVTIFGQTSVVINDSELLKKAFCNEEYAKVFNDRPAHFAGTYILFGCRPIIFGQLNKKTILLRKVLHKSLKVFGEGVAQFEQHMHEEISRLLFIMKAQKKEGFTLNELVKESFANWMSSLLTARKAEETDSKMMWRFLDSINAIALPGLNFILEAFPFLRNMPGKPGRLFKATIHARDQCLKRFVGDVAAKVDEVEGTAGLVNVFYKMRKEENEKAGYELIDELDIDALVLEIIFGGMESSSTAIINMFALLVQHPHFANCIQKEIDSVVGQTRMPNLNDKANMPFTKAFMLEALRYSTNIPLAVPHRARNDQTLEGYLIKKDSLIFVNTWFIHHDPSVWKDPWNFRPERFLDSTGQLLLPEHKLRQSVVTFSVGRRSCLGETLAMSRLFLYLTSVLQVFHLQPPSTGKLPITDPRFYSPAINRCVEDYLCKAVPRDFKLLP